MPLEPLRSAFTASLALLSMLPLMVSLTHAASITNRDDADHTVTIVEGGNQSDHVLVPGAILEGICLNGCIIRIDGNDVDPYVLDGSEITAIEGGDLYAEGQGPLAPSSGGTSQPSTPGPR